MIVGRVVVGVGAVPLPMDEVVGGMGGLSGEEDRTGEDDSDTEATDTRTEQDLQEPSNVEEDAGEDVEELAKAFQRASNCKMYDVPIQSHASLLQIDVPEINFEGTMCGYDARIATRNPVWRPQPPSDDTNGSDDTPCFAGVCDDPNFRNRYVDQADITFRLRLIAVRDPTDGFSITSLEDAAGQLATLNWAYEHTGIRFVGQYFECESPALARGKVLPPGFNFFGDNVKIVNAVNSGQTQCEDEMIGDGKCDTECNSLEASFDGGDCCLQVGEEPRDPSPALRPWLSREQYRSLINAPEDHYFNLYLVRFGTPIDVGVIFKAYVEHFPWEPGQREGMFMNVDFWGPKRNVVIHELGHVFGLYHTHHGVTETRGGPGNCADPCYERMEDVNKAMADGKSNVNDRVGDLCDDTLPTPKNYKCQDPVTFAAHSRAEMAVTDTCSRDGMPRQFINTPIHNFMGYTPNECRSEFSPCQTARIKCWLANTNLKRFVEYGPGSKP